MLLDATSSGAEADAVVLTSRRVHAVCCESPAAAGLPTVILVRPDGYVAWVSDDQVDVAEMAVSAVAQWCGPSPSVNTRAQ